MMKTAFAALTLSLLVFGFQKVSPKEAYNSIQAGNAILFDVRERDELKDEGMATPATHLAKSSIDAKDGAYQAIFSKLSKNKTLIFYCRSGKRAGAVADEFAAQGFKTLNMGGFAEWKDAGLPVIKP